jgi:hypothetical protein
MLLAIQIQINIQTYNDKQKPVPNYLQKLSTLDMLDFYIVSENIFLVSKIQIKI